MKIIHLLAYLYHRLFRHFHKQKGNWQNKNFEYHHKKMKQYKWMIVNRSSFFNRKF